MQSDRHSAQRMLDIVHGVCAAIEGVGPENPSMPTSEPSPDLGLLEDISGDDFDVSAVLERFMSSAHRN